MQLPVGEVFEIIIHWLKEHLDGVFNTISYTINFAISVLEHILLLDPKHGYPMVVMTLLIAGLIFAISRKKLGWKLALGGSVVIIALCASFGVWRNQQLQVSADVVELQKLKASIVTIETALSGSDVDLGTDDLSQKQGMTELRRLSERIDSVKEDRLRLKVFNLRNFERSREFLKHVSDAALPVSADAQALSRALASYHPSPLSWFPWLFTTTMLVLLAWLGSGSGLAIFALVGCGLIQSMGYWEPTVETLALVISATAFALLIGVPVGIGAAGSRAVDRVSKPVLDFMQTMPAFVYLIPAVLFFGLGKVPGAIATLIFAMPPAVRLTSLGIRGVSTEVVEAARSFGCTPMQLLLKAQLPIALPTILAGLNQTIMLALSMVVIGGMIGAGGLGEVVLSGIAQLKIGLGFESGLSVVILAIYLDRLTQGIGRPSK